MELTRAIADRRGTIAYRTRDPERFIGAPSTPDFIQSTQGEATEGVFRSVTLEGIPSYVAFSRSSISGWTSAVVVSVEVIDGPFRRSLLAIAASGGLAILVSVAGAGMFARRFARGIRSVAVAAEALAGGGAAPGGALSHRTQLLQRQPAAGRCARSWRCTGARCSSRASWGRGRPSPWWCRCTRRQRARPPRSRAARRWRDCSSRPPRRSSRAARGRASPGRSR